MRRTHRPQCGASQEADFEGRRGVSPRTVRWGGTLLPQAIGRAMEWPVSCPRRKLPAGLFVVPLPKKLRCRELSLRAHPPALWRHRVKAPPAKRVAPGDAPGGEQQPFDAAMGLDGFYAILAAGGGKAAVAAQPWADKALVEPDGRTERVPADAGDGIHCFAARSAGGTVAGGFAPGCFALSGRPAWAKSLATTSLSCQLFRRGVMPRATNTRS